ncbi:erv26 super protein [Naganishia albida]|nr:erv26 super protein [Naganishia albida]
MTLLHYLSYAGAIATFLFVTLSLASGLLWLAELIEEHSKTAKTIGIRAIYAIIALHIALYLIDGLPFLLILFSIAAHLVYLQNFTSTWPFISLTSARFLGSCCMVVADHFLWFFYFAEKAQEAKRYNSSSRRFRQAAGGKAGPTFMDVAAFFAVCVWFVPLFLFLSLSANDNVLPRMDQAPGTPSGLGPSVDLTSSPRTLASLDTSGTYFSSPPAGRTSLVKSLLAPVMSYVPGASRAGGRRRQHDEGIIAPRTPLRGSPLPSPRLSAVNLSLPGQTGSTWDDSSASGSGYGTPQTHGSDTHNRSSLGLSAPSGASTHVRRSGPSPKPSLTNLNMAGGAATASASTTWSPQGTWSPSAAGVGSPGRAPPPRRTASGSVGGKRTASAAIGGAEMAGNGDEVPALGALGSTVGGDGTTVRRVAGKAKDD